MLSNNNKILIVGLGNPDYDNTVHNVGGYYIRQQITDIKCELHQEYYYSPLVKGLYYAFNVSTMNISGDKIREIIKKHNIAHLIILYDDIRIKYGKYQIVFGGSHTGHNGIKSVVEKCSNLLHGGDFYRVRIGVGPKPSHMELSNYVLSKITHENQLLLNNNYGPLWLDIYKTCKKIIGPI